MAAIIDSAPSCITDVGAVQGIASNQLAEAVREITIAVAMLATVLWMDWRIARHRTKR